MRMARQLAGLLVAAGIGLAVGATLRAKRASHGHAPDHKPAWSATASLPSQTNSRPASTLRPGVRRQDDSPLATQLERDLAASTGVTRWLHLLGALEKAGPSDFPRLLRLARDNPAATRLIQARWVEVAPRHLFDLIVAGPAAAGDLPMMELAYMLFDEWPRRDPDAAIAAVNEASQIRGMEHWRFTVAYGLISTDVERSLRLMADWHTDETGFGPRGIAAITKWTRANPQHAAEYLLNLPDGHAFRSAMEPLGREWAKVDPAGALNFAKDRSGELASLLATHALSEWSQQNLADAAGWLSGVDDRTRRRLGPAFAEAWARQDAAGAVAWCEEHLAGSTLVQSIAGAMRGLADKNITAAAAIVADMNPSSARAEAALEVARKWFPGLASGQVAPSESIAWLRRLDADSLGRVMDRITWVWATSDAPSMATFLETANHERIPVYAYRVTGQELARKDPKEALQWASRLPGNTALVAGSAAFGEWQASQPQAAMQWWSRLPEADPRRQSYFESAIQNLAYHPQASERFTAMEPAQRAAARNVIQSMKLPDDRRAQLLQVLQSR